MNSYQQPVNHAVPQQMHGSIAQVVGETACHGEQRCRFRVTHSSGETVCVDLEAARAVQQQKPGAKIFLERDG